MLVQAAEAAILANDSALAISTLARVDDSERGEFWHHRMAQALVATDPDRALVHIDTALTAKQSRFRATYLQERYRIRRSLHQPGAVEDLEAAIAACTNTRHKTELQTELAAARSPGET